MNVLILAAGAPSEEAPLCLAELGGKLLLERIFENCRELNPARIIVVLRADEARKHHLESVIKLLEPRADVLLVRGATAGAACSALLAAPYIDNAEPLLVLSANELVTHSYADAATYFQTHGFDAGVMTFESVHPRYAFVKVEDDQVIEATEKRPISCNACAGFYWYAHGVDFVAGAKSAIRKDARVNNLFYVAPVFNELILAQKRIGIRPLHRSEYHPLKTPAQFELEARRADQPAY